MWQDLKSIGMNVYERMGEHTLGLVAAGVAFFGFLSVFPAIAALISIYGLVADAQMAQENVNAMSGFMPPEVQDIISTRIKDVATDQSSSLTVGLIASILLSLWSANKATKAIAKALNIIHEHDETRGFIKLNATTLLLTLLGSVAFIIVIGVTVVLPAMVNFFMSQDSAQVITTVLSWLLMLVVIVTVFVVMYRYAPDRDDKSDIKHTLPGAAFATFLVILGSIVLSIYVSNFGKYQEEYGAIAGVVVTLLWLYLSSFIFLLGAELNQAIHERKDESLENNGRTQAAAAPL